MFRSLDNNFNKSSILTKIELYLIPLLLIYLCNIFINYNSSEKIYTPLTTDFTKEYKEKSFILISKVDKIAKFYHINFQKKSYKNKRLSLSFVSSLNSSQKFLKEMENLNAYSSAKKLSFTKVSKNKYRVFISFSFEKFFYKNKISKKDYKRKNTKKKKFLLYAVINNKVLINSQWLGLKEKISGFTLIKIDKRSIILEKGEKKLLIRMDYER